MRSIPWTRLGTRRCATHGPGGVWVKHCPSSWKLGGVQVHLSARISTSIRDPGQRSRTHTQLGRVVKPEHAILGGVIGCKQFSCSGDAVWRLIMGCRRMLGAWDRAAIMAGVNVGLSKTRIAHLIGRSPSVVCREIARHTGPDGQYRAEEAGKAARAARRRPKKRLLDCDEVLRRRVIADLSQGHTPRQISGRLREEACGTLPSMDTSPDAQGHTISHEAIDTWIDAHPKKTLIEHGICLPSRRWMRKKPPASGRKPPIVGMRLIDERPDISDRKIPGNWEGDLIIGQDGASASIDPGRAHDPLPHHRCLASGSESRPGL